MTRTLTTTIAFLVAFSILSPAVITTTVSANSHTIDSCTVIDEPGTYELSDDISANETDSCIQIQADNVTINGNGHVLAGPGPDGNATGIALGSGDDNRNLVVHSIKITGWERGIEAGGSYTLEDAVVRDSGHGLHHDQGGAEELQNVTLEGNDLGIYTTMGGASGADVTIRDNEKGIFGMDGGNYDLEDSRVVDNEEYGIQIEHSSSLTLNDSTVSGNGDHGIYFPPWGMSVTGYIENTTVSDNDGDGIRAASDTYRPIRVVDVTVENNTGIEVNAAPVDEPLDSVETTSSITADGLEVGPSATTAFEEEAIRLEPVDRDSLPDRENGTVAGDGLNVSGNVSGPVDLELDVDTDDETVDLWRHDGSEWETVEEDLTVTDGTIEASIDRNGIYAPGTEADQQDDSDGTDDGDDTDDSDDSDDSDDTDGSDDTDDTDPSDQDGEKDKDTPTPTSSCGCPSSDGDNGSEASAASSESAMTDSPTETAGGQATSSPESDEQHADVEDSSDGSGDDVQSPDVDEDDSFADGPGFTAIGAFVALVTTALLVKRRE